MFKVHFINALLSCLDFSFIGDIYRIVLSSHRYRAKHLIGARRFDKLKLDYQYYGIQNKLKILDGICLKEDIRYNQIAYIGDDINDISVLEKVGLAACPKNAQPLVKNIPGIIQLTTKGGEGALREFINYII
jgi:YrbI family 3-deoxy-D-manno-octulosonate 8-phosphate phosphatase